MFSLIANTLSATLILAQPLSGPACDRAADALRAEPPVAVILDGGHVVELRGAVFTCSRHAPPS